MQVMGISDIERQSILRTVAAVLHIGNISFAEKGNYAYVQDESGNILLFSLLNED